MKNKLIWIFAGLCLLGFALNYLAQATGFQFAPSSKFRITIDDVVYTRSATLSPSLPITAHFEHSDPNVIQVRMQHPKNKEWNLVFAINKRSVIQNHSRYMEEGTWSYSDFIALDAKGKSHGRIRLTFRPRS